MYSARGHTVSHPLGCKLRSTYITDNKKAGQAPAFLLSELHKTDILALAAIMFVIIFCRMKRIVGIDTSRFLFFIIDTTTSSLRFLFSNPSHIFCARDLCLIDGIQGFQRRKIVLPLLFANNAWRLDRENLLPNRST